MYAYTSSLQFSEEEGIGAEMKLSAKLIASLVILALLVVAVGWMTSGSDPPVETAFSIDQETAGFDITDPVAFSVQSDLSRPVEQIGPGDLITTMDEPISLTSTFEVDVGASDGTFAFLTPYDTWTQESRLPTWFLDDDVGFADSEAVAFSTKHDFTSRSSDDAVGFNYTDSESIVLSTRHADTVDDLTGIQTAGLGWVALVPLATFVAVWYSRRRPPFSLTTEHGRITARQHWDGESSPTERWHRRLSSGTKPSLTAAARIIRGLF